MKIKQFDRQSLATVREDLIEMFKKYETTTGIKMSIGSISYDVDGSKFHTKLEAVLIDPKATPEENELKLFMKDAWMFNLTEKDYGRTFIAQGEKYKLIAILPSRRKYPFVGINSQGKKILFPRSEILNQK